MPILEVICLTMGMNELPQDEEGVGPKRRKLQGSSGGAAQKVAAQKKQPKPPPKKKKNRLGQRARKLLAAGPQVPSTQVCNHTHHMLIYTRRDAGMNDSAKASCLVVYAVAL